MPMTFDSDAPVCGIQAAESATDVGADQPRRDRSVWPCVLNVIFIVAAWACSAVRDTIRRAVPEQMRPVALTVGTALAGVIAGAVLARLL